MRCAARINAAMIRTPSPNSTACKMWVPVSPSPNKIASAQPPAKAAPNTSAPIRMAALMTVMTLGQTIWREDEEGAFMGLRGPCLRGPQSLRKGGQEQGQMAQKSPIACYSWPQQSSLKNRTCDVRTPPNYGLRDQPAAAGLGDAVRDPAVRRDPAGALPPGVRAGL